VPPVAFRRIHVAQIRAIGETAFAG
jgi:hypothetical protein